MRKRNKFVVGILGGLILFGSFLYGIFFLKNVQKIWTDTNTVNKKKVYLITKGKDSNFWKDVYSGARAACTEYNFELFYVAPKNEEDYEKQNELIYQAIEDDADAIIISAIDYEKNVPAIDEAANQGIKIINIDSEVNSEKRCCYIGTDNFKAGQLAGEAVNAKKGNKAKVGIVGFMQSTQNGKSREEGLMDVLCKSEKKELVTAIHVPSSIEKTKEGTKKMLQKNPEINCVVALNEILSVGVGNAIEELGLSEQVDVIVFDNNVQSVSMLETGCVDALVVQVPYTIGYLGVENVFYLLNGKTLNQETIDTICKVITQEDMYTLENQRLLFGLK